MHPQYFEAVIQIRPSNKTVVTALEGYISTHKNATVSKVRHHKSGDDYYMSSWRAANNLVRMLLKRFGGAMIISRKLHSERDGKKLYRSSVLYKPSPYVQGDVISCGEVVILLTALGKKVSGMNLNKMKKQMVNQKETWKVLEILKTRVTKTHPQLEVLHPETYESVIIENPKTLERDRKVKVVINRGKVYLVK